MTYSTAVDAPSIWQTPYNVIGRANRFEAAESGKKLTDAKEARILWPNMQQKQRLLRALVHFDLVRIYGKPYTAPDAPSFFGYTVVTT
ncbi:hypothetical protein NXU92_07085 [Bacteroides fragilis]|nr:hypothetical protein [Bacteroides fragilis]